MGARRKMARTLLAVTAAAALGLACADPIPATTASAPSEVSDAILTTTLGPQTRNMDNLTGTWWTFVRETIDAPYQTLQVDITRKTPEEIAVYKQSWLLQNNSRNETNQDPYGSINWQNVNFIFKMKLANNVTHTFLMEVSTETFHVRTVDLENWMIYSIILKITDGKLTLREVGSLDGELNLYRTLPNLATFARCENFDNFDASEAFNYIYLLGTWTANTEVSGVFFTLRVTTKTAEEISAYRVDLRNTTVEEADIDWMKVRLHAELFSTGNEVRVLGLIEKLDKPGFIRVIPLKETWDSFDTTEVENWFTSQNVITKRADWFLAVRNCNNPRQKAYFSRRPQIRTRKVLRKGSKTHSFLKHLTKAP